MTPSGIETATFRLVAQFINQMRQRVLSEYKFLNLWSRYLISLKSFSFLHWRWNIGRGCLRIGHWGRCEGLKKIKWQENGENCIMRSFMMCTAHWILCGWSEQGDCEGKKNSNRIWFKNRKQNDHFENLDVDGRIALKLINKVDMSLNTTKF